MCRSAPEPLPWMMRGSHSLGECCLFFKRGRVVGQMSQRMCSETRAAHTTTDRSSR